MTEATQPAPAAIEGEGSPAPESGVPTALGVPPGPAVPAVSRAPAVQAPPYPRAQVPSAAAVVAVATVAVVGLLAYLVGEALAIFVIGLILAYVLDPLVSRLAAHRVPRALGAILAIALLGLVVVLFAMLVVAAVIEQGAKFLATIPSLLDQFTDWYATASLPDALRTLIDSLLADIEAALAGIDIAAIAADVAASLFGLLGSVFTLFALPFFMFYILADRPRLSRSATLAVPERWREDVQTVARVVLTSFGTYVRAEAILMVLLGLITWAGLMGLSIVVDARIADFALFLALVAAVCELIPTFGPIIALVPALLFGLTLGPGPFVAIFLLYLVIMFIEGQVLVPKIEGGQFELHPSLVIVLILGGLALLGPLGAILALPVAAAGRDAVRYIFRRSTGMSSAAALLLDIEPAVHAEGRAG